MIRVLMGDKYRRDGFWRYIPLQQSHLNAAGADASVDQNAAVRRTDIRAIPAAAAE